MSSQTTAKPTVTVSRDRLRLAFAFVGATAAGAAAALTAAQFVGHAGLRRLSHGLGLFGLGGERWTRPRRAAR